jgi:hypothetical protein
MLWTSPVVVTTLVGSIHPPMVSRT